MSDMPKYILVGGIALRLDRHIDRNLAVYYRDAGDWSIKVVRRPDGTMSACHQHPFPEYIATAPVSVITEEQYKDDNRLSGEDA